MAGDVSVQVTISMGVASLSKQPINSVDDLVRLADSALYEAKKAGRNRVELA